MNRFPTLRRIAAASAFLAPLAALAHPGHDGDHGGGLTWDFSAEVAHYLTSPVHLLPALAVAAAGVWWIRRARTAAKSERADRPTDSAN